MSVSFSFKPQLLDGGDKTVRSDKRGWNGRGTSTFNRGAGRGKEGGKLAKHRSTPPVPPFKRAVPGAGTARHRRRGEKKANHSKKRLGSGVDVGGTGAPVCRALRESNPGLGLLSTREGNLTSGPAPAPPREEASPAPKGREGTGSALHSSLLGGARERRRKRGLPGTSGTFSDPEWIPPPQTVGGGGLSGGEERGGRPSRRGSGRDDVTPGWIEVGAFRRFSLFRSVGLVLVPIEASQGRGQLER